jgi:hypothetical protein
MNRCFACTLKKENSDHARADGDEAIHLDPKVHIGIGSPLAHAFAIRGAAWLNKYETSSPTATGNPA